ncbi:hypothetical protein, partial [Pseudomonas aeruginosa]
SSHVAIHRQNKNEAETGSGFRPCTTMPPMRATNSPRVERGAAQHPEKFSPARCFQLQASV